MKPLIRISACTDYTSPILEQFIQRVILDFTLRHGPITPSSRVLIKPNLLAPGAVAKRITTHPLLVKQVAIALLDLGAKVMIGDSPGIHSAQAVAESNGLSTVAKALGIPIINLKDPVPLPERDGDRFKGIEISREVAEADLIINLPKLKSHTLMGLTGAVKNCFGCIAGKRKAQYHVSAGKSTTLFAQLILQIAYGIKPALTIMDAVETMHGYGGPANGDPYDFGYLAAADDMVLLDHSIATMLGAENNLVFLQVAKQYHYGTQDLTAVDILDVDPRNTKRTGFIIPPQRATGGVFALVEKHLGHHVTPHPRHTPASCTYCARCREICPTEAIKITNKELSVDYKKCISCFCCAEVCPENAICRYDGLLSKLVGML